MSHDERITKMLGIGKPLLLAPMAGSGGSALAIAVMKAGGLGALPCAMLTPDQIRQEVTSIRAAVSGPVNLNFFCHREPEADMSRERQWLERLAPYYRELDVQPPEEISGAGRNPFNEETCALVEELKPEVVSFHFGLPDADLLERVFVTGAKVVATATTVTEARELEARGCDAIIAQGVEAGGHRGIFMESPLAAQPTTMALVPQIVDAVSVPVIAAGGIGDARAVAAAFALGASAVQLGTAFLRSPEALTSPVHRWALAEAKEDETVLTNIFTGRPARGIINRVITELGPIAPGAPAFPRATAAITPLRKAAEERGSGEFSPLWAGQAVPLAQEAPAEEIARNLMLKAEQMARPSFFKRIRSARSSPRRS